MIREEMTITQALVELKTLDDRILKAINNGTYIKVMQEKTSGETAEQVKTKIASSYQKVTDLMERYNAIKAAVVDSNAHTTVRVGTKTYTVAQAIDAKKHASVHKAALLKAIAAQAANAQREFTQMSSLVEKQATELVRKVTGESNVDTSKLSEDVLSIYDQYIDKNKISMVNPLNVADLLTKLSDELDEFALNVDTALSICNACTYIHISYGEPDDDAEGMPDEQPDCDNVSDKEA